MRKLALIVLIAIVVVAVILLLTVRKDKQETKELVEPIQILDQTIKTTVVELRLDGNVFEPDTIEVNQGDKVTIQFMNENMYDFAIPEYGIAESASSNYIEFEANQAGIFMFECSNCENAVTGILKVN